MPNRPTFKCPLVIFPPIQPSDRPAVEYLRRKTFSLLCDTAVQTAFGTFTTDKAVWRGFSINHQDQQLLGALPRYVVGADEGPAKYNGTTITMPMKEKVYGLSKKRLGNERSTMSNSMGDQSPMEDVSDGDLPEIKDIIGRVTNDPIDLDSGDAEIGGAIGSSAIKRRTATTTSKDIKRIRREKLTSDRIIFDSSDDEEGVSTKSKTDPFSTPLPAIQASSFSNYMHPSSSSSSKGKEKATMSGSIQMAAASEKTVAVDDESVSFRNMDEVNTYIMKLVRDTDTVPAMKRSAMQFKTAGNAITAVIVEAEGGEEAYSPRVFIECKRRVQVVLLHLLCSPGAHCHPVYACFSILQLLFVRLPKSRSRMFTYEYPLSMSYCDSSLAGFDYPPVLLTSSEKLWREHGSLQTRHCLVDGIDC